LNPEPVNGYKFLNLLRARIYFRLFGLDLWIWKNAEKHKQVKYCAHRKLYYLQ
jgi:hypothetical protein